MPTEGVKLKGVKLIDSAAEPAEFYDASASFWDARNQRIQRWREQLKQIDWYQRKHGRTGKYHTFEGNEASSFFAAMVQLLTKNPVRSNIPLQQATEDGRRLMGSVERLIEGTYRDVDFRRAKRGLDSDSLRSTLAKFACSDGWGVAEVVKFDSKKGPLVDVRTYDVINVAPEWASDGLLAVVLRTYRTKNAILLEYPHVDASNAPAAQIKAGFPGSIRQEASIPVYTVYWKEKVSDEEYNVWYGVAVYGQWAIEPYKLEWINEIPVSIVPMNGLPFRQNLEFVNREEQTGSMDVAQLAQVSDDWRADVGRGIFFQNENLYGEFNKLWATILDFVDREGHGTYFKKTKEGDDNDMVIGRGSDAINALETDDEIGRIPPGTLAQELNLALGEISSAMQRGGISWQLMGQLPAAQFSGFAINQLLSAALTVAEPYIAGLQTMYQQLNDFIIEAYKHAGRNYMEVNVWREKTFVQERIDLGLLHNKKFWFDVKIKPGLPNDIATRVNVAGLAKRDGLLDGFTIADEILDLDDPQTVLDRIDEESIMKRPTIQLRRLIMQMLSQGNREAAIALLMELRLVESSMQLQQDQIDVQMTQFEQALHPNQGASVSPITGQGGAGPGGAAPEASPMMSVARGGGLPPNVSPPEQNGASPASLRVRSALGNF